MANGVDFQQKKNELTLDSLPNDNVLVLYKLKAFADDKINVIQKQNSD